MRLTEDRINAISEKAARHLVRKKLVSTRHNLRQLAAWIEKPMMEYFRVEDEIDEQVQAQISALSKPPPYGSADYQALFRKKKDELLRRRGYSG